MHNLTKSCLAAAFLLATPYLHGEEEKDSAESVMSCLVSDFRLEILTSGERARAQTAFNWLSKFGKDCSLTQLYVIFNQRSQWLGTADTPQIASTLERLLEVQLLSQDISPAPLFEGKRSGFAPYNSVVSIQRREINNLFERTELEPEFYSNQQGSQSEAVQVEQNNWDNSQQAEPANTSPSSEDEDWDSDDEDWDSDDDETW